MTSILEHISLTQLRACKNRTSLELARSRAARQNIAPGLISDIATAAHDNAALITQLDEILDYLGRSPGPTQP